MARWTAAGRKVQSRRKRAEPVSAGRSVLSEAPPRKRGGDVITFKDPPRKKAGGSGKVTKDPVRKALLSKDPVRKAPTRKKEAPGSGPTRKTLDKMRASDNAYNRAQHKKTVDRIGKAKARTKSHITKLKAGGASTATIKKARSKARERYDKIKGQRLTRKTMF